MPEENEKSLVQELAEKKQQQNQRNVANNANLVRNAADIASKSGHPLASGIGKAVKVADKVSGGKVSKSAGKALNLANKLTPEGRLRQAALNKLTESGTANRIAGAMSKKNSGAGSLNKMPQKGKVNSNNDKDSALSTIKDKGTEKSSDSVEATFGGSLKVVKYGLIGCAAILPVVIFCCLFISASQIYLSAISLGQADSVSSQDAEDKINKKGNQGSDEEITDEVSYDIYIADEKTKIFRDSKLNSKNVVQIEEVSNNFKLGGITYLERKYNEGTLSELEDFYPAIKNLSKNYDENMVYDFFFKMYKLYVNYRDKYNVYLDTPLLMATLNLQSNDKYVIFESNLSDEYRTDDVDNIPIDQLDYYYDWSNYVLHKNNSEHDMELLAQNMVSIDETGNCENKAQDGKCYIIDDVKYREFLKQFLEKKYYLSSDANVNNESSSQSSAASGAYTTWTQCGQSWSSIIVPNSSSTICQIGCLLTSVTIQIARSNTAIVTDTINPGIAVEKYKFTKGGYFLWNSATNIAPNFIYYSKIMLTGMNQKSIIEKLNSYDSNRYYIILGVSRKNSNKITHWVALDYIDVENNKIYMMDPAAVNDDDVFEKYKVYQAHLYEKKD